MKPRPQRRDAFELFQSHFDQMLDPDHELVLLANKIDWAGLDAAFVDCYRPDIGAPAKAVRLMVGLHYLKYTFNESDESVVDRWVENPYWQYFCGYTHMQHECPIHPTSMTKWRNRVGAERLERLVAERSPWPFEKSTCPSAILSVSRWTRRFKRRTSRTPPTRSCYTSPL